MQEKTLYIHIGCHKTGTTSIQHTLALNESVLQAKGLYFYYRDFNSGENKLPDLHSWLRFVQKKKIIPKGMRIRDADKLAAELSKIKGDVIVSSENFSFVFDKSEILSIQNALSKVFTNIKIICYLRRQDLHVVSHHQEGAKLKRAAEYDLYGHSARALPPYNERHELYLNYFTRLSMWADAFGDENMIVKLYDRKELLKGDVVADFFNILNIVAYKGTEDKNISSDFHKAKLGHLVNGSSMVHKGIIFHNVVPKSSGNRKLLPSKKDALDYYGKFLDSNRLLNSRFKISTRDAIFDDDFDVYPDIGTDLWDEQTANEVILSLLNRLDDLYGAINVDDLTVTALTIEKHNINIINKLMFMAHKLRPDGQLIEKKLDEYEILEDEK